MIAIDTNVSIYSLDRNDIEKRAKARSLLRQLRRQPDAVIIPWQVMGELLRFSRSLQEQKHVNREDVERIFSA